MIYYFYIFHQLIFQNYQDSIVFFVLFSPYHVYFQNYNTNFKNIIKKKLIDEDTDLGLLRSNYYIVFCIYIIKIIV